MVVGSLEETGSLAFTAFFLVEDLSVLSVFFTFVSANFHFRLSLLFCFPQIDFSLQQFEYFLKLWSVGNQP